jgi:acid phosphatase
MALTGGQTFFTTDCQGCIVSANNVADQVYNAGRKWKGYFEGMPAPCTTTDSGEYAQRHNPFVHYSDIVNDTTRCRNHIVPLTSFYTDLANGTLPNYVWITPDVCNDMHDCSVATGDRWLENFVPQIVNSAAFTNSVIFLVWDEGTTTTGGGGHVPLIVVSPRTPAGYRSANPYNHYSLLRTIETAWGMPALGKASTAVPMAEFFK